MATYAGECRGVQRPSAGRAASDCSGVKRQTCDTRRHTLESCRRAPSARLVQPSANKACLYAPSDVPENRSIRALLLDQAIEGHPMNAPCEPPPCKAEVDRTGWSTGSSHFFHTLWSEMNAHDSGRAIARLFNPSYDTAAQTRLPRSMNLQEVGGRQPSRRGVDLGYERETTISKRCENDPSQGKQKMSARW